MADILLKEGTPATLTMGATTVTNGSVVSSTALTLGAADDTARPDAVRVDVSYSGGTLGSAANVYLSQGNTAGEYDGNCPVNNSSVGAAVLPNLGVPVPVISQAAGASRGSAVFKCSKARLVVVVENLSVASISALSVTVTPLYYQAA